MAEVEITHPGVPFWQLQPAFGRSLMLEVDEADQFRHVLASLVRVARSVTS